MSVMQQMNAPKRVVRDAQGRVAGVEPMPVTLPVASSPAAASPGPVEPDPFAQ